MYDALIPDKIIKQGKQVIYKMIQIEHMSGRDKDSHDLRIA